ncbi:hypothetical protein GCM10027043_52550 [Ferruginibacter profundus]
MLGVYYAVTYTSEKKKYIILNEIIKDDSLYFFKVCKQTNRVSIFESNTSEFSLFDKLYIFTQKLLQPQQIKEDKIEYYTLRPETKHSARIVDSCDRKFDFVYKISLPIVSSDNKVAMININEDCNCGLGGYWGTFVFRKENGKWKLVKTYNYIIS